MAKARQVAPAPVWAVDLFNMSPFSTSTSGHHLQCPVCRQPLQPSTKGFQCTNAHSFDAARQGYVNLLLSHQKHSKEPGDSPDMIRSRRLFLNQGFYNPLSLGLNQAIAATSLKKSLQPLAILDAGCGEGFYLQNLKDFLTQERWCQSADAYYGVDISKYGVRQATQRDKDITWIVASSADLPFRDSCLDLLISIFAPVHFDEFARVLKPRGELVLLTPGMNHLKHLREVIYKVVRERSQAPILEQNQAYFSLTEVTPVTYETRLQSQTEILNLLAMTPYFWNIDLAAKARVEALAELTLDVDVNISRFKKIQ